MFLFADSKHVKSGLIMGVLKATWRGMKYCEMQGDNDQQGGSFIVGPGECIPFSILPQLIVLSYIKD